MNAKLVIAVLVVGLCGCKKEENTLFTLLPKEETGVDFVNTIKETPEINIVKLEYLYNGGGVAVADFNHDGLKDLFFTASLVDNRLYLNKGNMKFEDITNIAGIQGKNKWKSGVAIADVNGDGWDDIYVCATILGNPRDRENMLFIHQGLNPDGIPVFKDEAVEYGVNDADYSSNALFIDYDNDGDLDLYVLTNAKQLGVPITYRAPVNDGTSPTNDKLYRNNGDGSFTNVTAEAGIIYEGYGLGISTFDVNDDGWLDIYISNDYLTNDVLYVNHHGTFVNEIDSMIQHQSKFSMGNDIADINNDGHPDIITLDMLPEDNYRKKTVIGGAGYINYIYDKRFGYTHQYTRNMLQVNNGDGTFSEIGQLSGIYQTEWSWSPLFADFDNDGKKDLIITNGFPKDITDKDFISFRNEVGQVTSIQQLLDKIPSVEVPNYAFKNSDGINFSDVTKEWGMNQPSFSNGAAYADLDNDGDLDYIVNNINSPAFVYKNNLYPARNEEKKVHYLKVKLAGPTGNPAGEGARILLVAGKNQQYYFQSTSRGYISRIDPDIHFGLGEESDVDTVAVIWPDGRREVKVNITSDQKITFEYRDSRNTGDGYIFKNQKIKPLVENLTAQTGLDYTQPYYDVIDFNYQRTLPHKFSEYGPALAVGDINGDHQEDLIVGGYAGAALTAFLQQSGSTFKKQEISGANEQVTMGVLLFDADNDKDLDIYAVGGGFRYEKGSKQYQDLLYINDGKGNFTPNPEALPEMTESGSVVRASDLDNDGDLDLFVGGRVVPAEYPMAPRSSILLNEGGKFTDHTSEICPDLERAGMITDALFTDVNNDNEPDLLVSGEFMPVKLFVMHGGKLTLEEHTGLEEYSGWWNSLTSGDFDQDGDMDYIAGNLGTNNNYNISDRTPLCIYADDYDDNNSIDAILACHLKQGDSTNLFPVHLWEDLVTQSPKFRKRFTRYSDYGRATIDSILTKEEIANSYQLHANYIKTSFLRNNGDGTFEVTALPVMTQTSPVYGMITYDVNRDGNEDILMQGNDFGNEVFTGNYDAMKGLVLLGDGKGNFTIKNHVQSGFRVEGNAKSLVILQSDLGPLFVSSQNKGSLKVYRPLNDKVRRFKPATEDRFASVTLANGKTQKVEFYFGNGYLSQSSRDLLIPEDAMEVKIYNAAGEERIVSREQSM